MEMDRPNVPVRDELKLRRTMTERGLSGLSLRAVCLLAIS
jgi:hypothetical protein